MTDSSNIDRAYDITDLLKLPAKAFQHLDVRVTVTNGRGGDRVVVIDAQTRRDVSVALNDFEAEALGLRLSTAYPQENCGLHRPYRRGRRAGWSLMSDCTCAVVFQSRLLARRVEAQVNALHQANTTHRQVATGVRADWATSEERWPGALQASLFASGEAQ